jgi:hypothetical protein
MAGAEAPGPGDRGSGAQHDRELWLVLGALLADRPALDPVTEPTDPDTFRAAERSIAETIRQLDRFADEVAEALLSSAVPAHAGSARAIANSVVRLCRAFSHHWAHRGGLTATHVAEFNRDIDLVAVMLGAIPTGVAGHTRLAA